MAAPDEWELFITSTSRLQLERALERLLRRDAALLASAIDGEPDIRERVKEAWRNWTEEDVEKELEPWPKKT